MNESSIKCVSLWQPWATLWVRGDKQNETRSWFTRYRGWLAVHAAKRRTADLDRLITTKPFSDVLARVERPLDVGVIVGFVHVVDCVKITPNNIPQLGNEFAFGDYTPGRFKWVTNARREVRRGVDGAHKLRMKGAQGLFIPDFETLTRAIDLVGGLDE